MTKFLEELPRRQRKAPVKHTSPDLFDAVAGGLCGEAGDLSDHSDGGIEVDDKGMYLQQVSGAANARMFVATRRRESLFDPFCRGCISRKILRFRNG